MDNYDGRIEEIDLSKNKLKKIYYTKTDNVLAEVYLTYNDDKKIIIKKIIESPMTDINCKYIFYYKDNGYLFRSIKSTNGAHTVFLYDEYNRNYAKIRHVAECPGCDHLILQTSFFDQKGQITKREEYKYTPDYNNITVIKYVTPAISNLRFRKSPSLTGEYLRLLCNGEKLELIDYGKEEIIGTAKGIWIKVRTEHHETGWCFDAYIEDWDFSFF
ncbi:MAG: SH3 domain-containing protein [Spirochaetes bacterium]|nr:SH3 domain-containing protein [Spirochaetota bacterium]